MKNLAVLPASGPRVAMTPTEVYKVARKAGFGILQAQAATVVAFAESSGRYWIVNPSPCGEENGRTLHAVGLMGICNYSSRGTTQQLQDPLYNMQQAYAIWKEWGWGTSQGWAASKPTWSDEEFIKDIAMKIDIPIIIGGDGSPSGGWGNIVDALIPNLPGGEAGNKVEDVAEGILGGVGNTIGDIIGALLNVNTWIRIAAVVGGAILLFLGLRIFMQDVAAPAVRAVSR